MAKKIKTNVNDDVNASEIDGVEIVDEEQAEREIQNRRGGNRRPDITPWEDRRLIIEPIEKPIMTPGGTKAMLVVEVREGVKSFSPKYKMGRRNQSGRINSSEIWGADLEELLPMAMKAMEQANVVLLAEEEERAEKRRSRLQKGFTMADLVSKVKDLA